MADPHAMAQIAALQDEATETWEAGDPEAARELWFQSLALCQDAEDGAGEALCWHRLGAIALRLGETERAERDFQAALMLYRDLHDRTGYAGTLHQLGAVCLGRGAFEEARRLSRAAMKLQDEIGDTAGVARALYQIAVSHMEEDDIAAAAGAFGEAIKVMKHVGDFAGMAVALQNLAVMAEQAGNPDESFRFMAASAAVQAGSHQPTAEEAMAQAREQGEKAGIDPDEFDASLERAAGDFLSDDGAAMIAAVVAGLDRGSGPV